MTDSPTDTRDRSVLFAIVEELAAARDADPLDLPPLQDYVDTDALVSLVGTRTAAERNAVHQLRFRVGHHEVSVTGDGRVEVADLGTGRSVTPTATHSD
jgi:hypothetical protein